MSLHLKIIQNEDEFIIMNSTGSVIGYYHDNTLELGGRWYHLEDNVVNYNKQHYGKLIDMTCEHPAYYKNDKLVGMCIRKENIDLMINELSSQQDRVLMIISEILRVA